MNLAEVKAVWIGRTDSGVVRQRLYDRGITHLYYSPLDPGAKTHIEAVRAEGKTPGLYSDPHWYGLAGDGNAVKYRQQLDADCARLLKPTEPLQTDLEFISMDYVTRLVMGSPGNRGLVGSGNPEKPTGTQISRDLRYTNMPFQNGTVVPIPTLVTAGLHFDPQLYYSKMEQAAEAAVCLELARWGVPADHIHPFRDGKLIASDDRDAVYFTAERIPGVFSASHFTSRLSSLTKEGLRAHYTQLAQAA